MKVLTNVVLCALFVACLAIRSVESQCQGAADESSLQAQLASPTSGSLITICSNINLTETLVIRAPTTVQGNCSSRCKISAALPRTVNQLVSVAPGTGPVFFRNLQLDGGLAESGETGTLLTGGAVLLSPSSTTTFTNVLFTNNAADEGGAVYSSSANATFVGCTFTSNTATASGGAFQAAGGSAVILSSTFQQNNAPLGGAVYLQQTAVPAVVRGSLFVGNQATTQEGGAIFVSVRAVNVSIGGNTFAGNTATVSGGAIHDDGASQNGAVVSTAFTVLSGNAFSQNTAPRGGAVSSNVAQTSFCNAQLFINNLAPTGSNLFATGSEDSGDTKFCPTAPSDSTSGAFAADVGGVFASDCSYCNCGPNNPCDPNAVCTPGSRSGSGTNLTCACRSGFSGNGYVCLGASNSSLLVGNTGASTSPAALASFTTSNSSVLSPGAAPSRAPAPAPVAAPAPSLVNGTLANSTTATAPSANATAPNGSLPNATGLNGTVPTATVRNGTAANGSLPANRTAPVPAPGPIAALAPGGAVIITNSSAPAPTNATGFAPAAGPSGNGSALVVPLPINATANGTVPAPAPSLNGTVPIPTNATVNISGPASAPLSAPPPRGTNASFPPPMQPNVTTSPPPPQGTNASFPPPLQPNVTSSPPPPAFPPPAPVATNASAPPPIVPDVTLAPPPPLPAATNATAPPPLEPNVTLAPPPPLPEATIATSPPPDAPPLAAPPPQSPPPNLPPPSLPPPGAPPPPQPTVPVIVTPNQGSPPPVSVPPPPAASPSPPAPTGGLLGGPAAPPPPVCSCPPGQAPGIGATATACDCNYPLTASYRLVDRNLQDWTPTFATSFTSDVAGLLGVQPSQILYTNVQQGSILLDTNVVPLSGATLDNATVTRISGVLQQGQPLNLSESQYGQVLVTSVGLPAQLTSDPPSPSTGVTTPSGPTPSTSPGTTTTSSGGGGSNIGAIIGGVVGGVVFLAVVLAVLVALVKRKRRKQSLPPAAPPVLSARPPKSLERPLSARERAAGGRESGQLPTPGREDIADKALFGTFRRFGFPEVQQATDDFAQANLLGEGGFGMVYKGMFGDGTMLAVKLLKNTQQGQAESEFLSELGTLGRVRHRNLVALKGFCVSSEDCFLILDYAAGGNLDQALRNPTRPVLTWPQRMNIAVGAARGLSYLHNDCRPTIIHRDIKSANILLDADGEAEVADFGLSKLLDSGQTHQSTRVRGTYGYVAPEYAMYGQVTKKTDVYSFGVVLLELITGLKALDVSQSGERRTLTEWVLKRHQQPLTIIDPRLEGEYFRDQAEKFISLALACINPSPERRPAMLDILRTLETLNPSGSVPASPLGSPERSGEMQDVYPSTSSDWSAGTGSGTRRTPLRPSSGNSGSSPVGTTFDWSQGHNSTILHNTTQYNMTGINEGR